MLSPNDKYYVTYRTREHEHEVRHIFLVQEALQHLIRRPSIFEELMAALGRKLVRIGSNLEKRYSHLADECGRENLKSLPTG